MGGEGTGNILATVYESKHASRCCNRAEKYDAPVEPGDRNVTLDLFSRERVKPVLMSGLVVLLCVAFTPRVPKQNHPIVQNTFTRHARLGTHVSTHEMRRAVRVLGTDLSRNNTHRLMQLYGTNDTLTSEQFHTLLYESDSTSPSRIFWLRMDPANENGILSNRPRWNKFARSGLLTPTRIAHYATGLAALGLGTLDFVNAVYNGGVLHLSEGVVLVHALMHTSVAYLSLARFKYTWTPGHPFYLWLKTARDANMWPTFILFTWYTLACASDFASATASIHTNESWFLILTSVACATIMYGIARMILEDDENISGVYTTRLANSLQVVWSMGGALMADFGKCLVVSLDTNVHAEYVSLIAQYPEYTNIQYAILLQGMFIGNLMCALSSAEHYGAITKAQIGDLGNVVTMIGVGVPLFATCAVDHGQLAYGMMSVTWKGLCSLV